MCDELWTPGQAGSAQQRCMTWITWTAEGSKGFWSDRPVIDGGAGAPPGTSGLFGVWWCRSQF